MLDLVESQLFPRYQEWEDVTEATDPKLVNIILDWAWQQSDVQSSIREAFWLENDDDTSPYSEVFYEMVNLWLQGKTFSEMSDSLKRTVDDILYAFSKIVSFTLQSIVEQGIALLERIMNEHELNLSVIVSQFPDLLRFGIPNYGSRALSISGVRHRNAAVNIGSLPEVISASYVDTNTACLAARSDLLINEGSWRETLGNLVYERTYEDLDEVVRAIPSDDDFNLF